ncbi:HoxN/HupN/NixA family nickel/cobalt transporter [Modestobacter altitudinis]|uniref:HoxN/HupN/NixA family nickel/cobalt transporter n=1 Tax=Modestobacter altitudinis TaxID=2213158 RepID=UPI001FE9CE9E|nr:HoxN/HupN/NixA family nickel/cobalt transporter [Modestobacter altitudinis]
MASVRDNRRTLIVVFSTIVLMTVAGWAILLLVLAPRQLAVGGSVLGFGLGLTAYVLGARHAFDADHIAAIDNTTRNLLVEGRRSVSVGFWFALGHSAMVGLLSALVGFGAHVSATLLSEESNTRQVLGSLGTAASGLFLFAVGVLNLFGLRAIWRVLRSAKSGALEDGQLDDALATRGLVARFFKAQSIRRPWHMLLVGMLFGLGFDTASEIALLVLAGSGAASGLPWYGILVLPLLFAAGMTLFDTLDGLFMSTAYQWALAKPMRKLYYNLTMTGLSVAVALLIGTIELVGAVHTNAGLTDPVSGWISSLRLDHVGYFVAGLFVLVWAGALVYWRIAGGDRPVRAAVRDQRRERAEQQLLG